MHFVYSSYMTITRVDCILWSKALKHIMNRGSWGEIYIKVFHHNTLGLHVISESILLLLFVILEFIDIEEYHQYIHIWKHKRLNLDTFNREILSWFCQYNYVFLTCLDTTKWACHQFWSKCFAQVSHPREYLYVCCVKLLKFFYFIWSIIMFA